MALTVLELFRFQLSVRNLGRHSSFILIHPSNHFQVELLQPRASPFCNGPQCRNMSIGVVNGCPVGVEIQELRPGAEIPRFIPKIMDGLVTFQLPVCCLRCRLGSSRGRRSSFCCLKPCNGACVVEKSSALYHLVPGSKSSHEGMECNGIWVRPRVCINSRVWWSGAQVRILLQAPSVITWGSCCQPEPGSWAGTANSTWVLGCDCPAQCGVFGI